MTAFMSDDSTSAVESRVSGVGERAQPYLRLSTTADRVLIRRLLIIAASIVVVVAAFSRLDLLYSHKFFDNTGRAQWIWPVHRMAAGDPVAFFATYDFDLPPNRAFTKIKMLGDPEYTLYFNGAAIGGRRVGDGNEALDTYDVSTLARDRKNRIVVAVRSANGVGGLILAIDLTSEFANFVVTGSDWHIVRGWRDDLLLRDPPANDITQPQLLGRPPARRWNYLAQRAAPLFAPAQRVVAPRQSFDFVTALPEIAVVGGTAVTVSRKTSATAYDFGVIQGRARLTIRNPGTAARDVIVRFAYDRADLFTIDAPVEHVVFAAGEKTIVDEQLRTFRYITVYGGAATVDVVQ
ncbi:MAG: hypothetical protein QOK37_1054 [Thermoanaerobaculia bacterium]|jgi:hypothetical protein|nr:hypothetical protein [Thermoanaerobaculia bacterium]